MMERKINKRDVILGITMIILSLYIFLGNNVIIGNSILKENIVIGRADFYIKFLATIFLVISIVLIIKSVRAAKTANSSSPTSNVIKLSFLSLIIYTIILKHIGFFFSSFLLITFLSFIIRLKEMNIDLKDKKDVTKAFIISVLFSSIAVLIIMYVFTNWLNVILP